MKGRTNEGRKSDGRDNDRASEVDVAEHRRGTERVPKGGAGKGTVLRRLDNRWEVVHGGRARQDGEGKVRCALPQRPVRDVRGKNRRESSAADIGKFGVTSSGDRLRARITLPRSVLRVY